MTIDMSNTSFCHGFWIDLFRVYKCKETSIRTAVFALFEYITQPDFHLGATSKLNRRSTGGSVRFRAVVIVSNNRNQPEQEGTAGPVNRLGFEAKTKQTNKKQNKQIKKKKRILKIVSNTTSFCRGGAA